jgi:hypothetical protein
VGRGLWPCVSPSSGNLAVECGIIRGCRRSRLVNNFYLLMQWNTMLLRFLNKKKAWWICSPWEIILFFHFFPNTIAQLYASTSYLSSSPGYTRLEYAVKNRCFCDGNLASVSKNCWMYCIFCIETLEWGLCSAPEPSRGDFAVLRPTLFRGCYVGYGISELHLIWIWSTQVFMRQILVVLNWNLRPLLPSTSGLCPL